jgi:hypothetical protein
MPRAALRAAGCGSCWRPAPPWGPTWTCCAGTGTGKLRTRRTRHMCTTTQATDAPHTHPSPLSERERERGTWGAAPAPSAQSRTTQQQRRRQEPQHSTCTRPRGLASQHTTNTHAPTHPHTRRHKCAPHASLHVPLCFVHVHACDSPPIRCRQHPDHKPALPHCMMRHPSCTLRVAVPRLRINV